MCENKRERERAPTSTDGGVPFADAILGAVIVGLTKEAVSAIMRWLKARKEKGSFIARVPSLKIMIGEQTFQLNPEQLQQLADILK
jgi:hypothetical protein